ncbi:PEP-CTERM sorting domain-containing protein [Motiliproteus coralliicola]|uniref:PEP-CTERM sorting domain-containing protein n=1 Tax=Motiliproteus coralliicola TaxID=2283196 RepID=A0A369WF51_9GAMM|nr:choice-of-anchor L domain-containing protein [Motiliproteus coralliicola]RDE19789.1 PEP-CTERM sorting domain-containing protein [Motiliproteus coralliicola]
MSKRAPRSTQLAQVGLMMTLAAGSAQAVVFQQYNDLDPAGFLGDGSELATALVTPDSGISIVGGSSQYQGNFDNAGGFDGEFDGEFVVEPLPVTPSYGSASFFQDLNFGTIDGVEFSLPDGILLTSGNAAPAEMNTESGFTGLASGMGDSGLDQLLASQGINEFSADATVLSFDFTVDSGVNAVSLDFIFGSEEFPEFVDSFPEIAAVFVDGVNYAGFADGGLLTVTSDAVGGGNFFDNNIHDDGTLTPSDSPLAIEYDGVSRPLNLLGLLDSTRDTHTIKIAVSDTSDTALDTGIFVGNLQGLMLDEGGITADDPILPDPDGPTPGFDFVVDVGDTGFGIDPTLPIFFDPFVATGYTYEANGSNFATVIIPNSYGDGQYNLYYWDGTSFVFADVIGVNDQFDFLSIDPNGVSMFMIDGIEIGAALDPDDPNAFVTGLTFTNGGTIQVTQTAIQTCDGSADCASAQIPEPGTLVLLLGGLLGMSRITRRR